MIAHYTQRMIDDLQMFGRAEAPFDVRGVDGLTQIKARSRLHNAASRAGLKVTTTVEYDDREGRRGAVIATVVGRQ